jgi:hypothetical protein
MPLAENTPTMANAGGMDRDDQTNATPPNPYRFETDAELETYARGVIDEAIAKSAVSPRQFAYYSSAAAKQLTQYVLERYARREPSG